MRLVKDGAIYEIANEIQIKAFLGSGWTQIEDSGDDNDVDNDEDSGNDNDGPELANLPDEDLAALAAEFGVDIEGKTRRQAINALKKAQGG